MARLKWMDTVEKWHNWASDRNFVWFPFLFLKLKPQQHLGTKRVLLMVCCFASYFNVVYSAKKILLVEPIDLQAALLNQVSFMVLFLFWFTFVTRPLWNRRSNRLSDRT